VEITSHVIGVQGRQTKAGVTWYDVAFADGNTYSTKDGVLAGKAQSLVGQNVSANVETQQRGQYTNKYLNDIAPAGQLPAASTPNPNGVANAQATLNSAPPLIGGVPPIPVSSGGMDPAREAKIVKQSLLSTSLGFVGQLYSGAGPEVQAEALEAGLTIAKALYAEVMGGQTPAPAPTPQAVAAAVPGVQVGSEDLKTW
jgi:hypothetical protein